MKINRIGFCLLGIFLMGMNVSALANVTPLVLNDSETIQQLESLPVQHGGRIKPYKGFAQETVLYITGRTRWEGNNPTALIFSWMSNPQAWRLAPILKVAYEPLRTELGLKVINGKISVENVLDYPDFVQKAGQYNTLQDEGENLTTIQEKHLGLYNRAFYMQTLLQGRSPGAIANPTGAEEGWLPLAYLNHPEGMALLANLYSWEAIGPISEKWQGLLKSIQEEKEASVLREQSRAFVEAIYELFEERQVVLDQGVLEKELFYHNTRPFRKAWMLYGLTLILSLMSLLFAGKTKTGSAMRNLFLWTALGLFLAGILLHTYGMYLRVMIAGRPPVSNMYESMIWVSWVAATMAFIYYLFSRSSFVLNWAALVSVIVLLLAEGFPVVFSPAIDTLVPVLRSNLWLTVHVLTITMSYGAFALAWGLGHGIIVQTAFKSKYAEPNPTYIRYLHRILLIGVALLAAGTILGGVWANYSWGRFWGWDPKETWALIALLGYLAVLHGRFAGWFGSFGLAAGAVIAFLGVVMAWYGVNYVLAAGLHSYGFGGGGAAYVLSIAGLDLLFVLICILKRSKMKPSSSA